MELKVNQAIVWFTFFMSCSLSGSSSNIQHPTSFTQSPHHPVPNPQSLKASKSQSPKVPNSQSLKFSNSQSPKFSKPQILKVPKNNPLSPTFVRHSFGSASEKRCFYRRSVEGVSKKTKRNAVFVNKL